jgi:hypothetical protein
MHIEAEREAYDRGRRRRGPGGTVASRTARCSKNHTFIVGNRTRLLTCEIDPRLRHVRCSERASDVITGCGAQKLGMSKESWLQGMARIGAG